MAEPNPYRKWFKVGMVVSIAWAFLSLISWFYGPIQDESAIEFRLFLTGLGMMGVVASVVGMLATSW